MSKSALWKIQFHAQYLPGVPQVVPHIVPAPLRNAVLSDVLQRYPASLEAPYETAMEKLECTDIFLDIPGPVLAGWVPQELVLPSYQISIYPSLARFFLCSLQRAKVRRGGRYNYIKLHHSIIHARRACACLYAKDVPRIEHFLKTLASAGDADRAELTARWNAAAVDTPGLQAVPMHTE